MQDARKGVLFDDFPPVLQLQLKRFEYDFQRDIMVKVCACNHLGMSYKPSALFDHLGVSHVMSAS